MGKTLQTHLPYEKLLHRFDDVVSLKLNPEVYFSSEVLTGVSTTELKRIGGSLSANGRTVTVHGPFMDLSPGAADEGVRELSVSRYEETIAAASALGAKCVVFHAEYDARRFDEDVELWLGQSLKTWPALASRAEDSGLVIALENIFEEEPSSLKRIVEGVGEAVGSDSLGVCIDAGHMNIFSKAPMEEWFRVLGPYVREVHLHDNHGEFDEHLAVGEGVIDFERFFELAGKFTTDPIWTLEAHDEDTLKRTLEAVQRFL